ncbi:MAG: cyclic nucleotide-binding domain-containing protein [Chloroflexi bacterium]|nr:cyclic nucleotide-binding domain-containing protein [Chloroflexota bacterium]
MDSRKTLIKQIPLFAPLHSTEIQYLAEILHESEVPAHTLLFREDEPGNRFYIIMDGQIEIIKALGTPDERLLAVRGAGEFFGEMSLLDPDGLRTASVRTRTPVRLLEMARPDFEALLQHRPALACEMVRVLSLRLRDTDNATIADLREKNRQLAQAYAELQAAQVQIIEKEKLEQELQTAHWIQQSILPRRMPHLPGFDFGARLEPARAVGGDLFDFIPLGRDRVGVVIGDVSDKGVPAAIFMALAYSLLRAEASRSASPVRVLQRVNQLLMDMNDAGMFVTVLYGVVDQRQGDFTYARAGHELPLLLDPHGDVHLPVYGPGQPLGLFDAPFLDEQTIPLPPGRAVLLYTDGATDLTSPENIPFGLERLQAAAQASLGGTAQVLCDQVWRALTEYQGASAQADDVALVALQAQ